MAINPGSPSGNSGTNQVPQLSEFAIIGIEYFCSPDSVITTRHRNVGSYWHAPIQLQIGLGSSANYFLDLPASVFTHIFRSSRCSGR